MKNPKEQGSFSLPEERKTGWVSGKSESESRLWAWCHLKQKNGKGLCGVSHLILMQWGVYVNEGNHGK